MKYFASLFLCLASQLTAATATYHPGVAVVAQAQHCLFDPAAAPEPLKALSRLLLAIEMKSGDSCSFIQAAQQGGSADDPEFNDVFKKAVDFYQESTIPEKVKQCETYAQKIHQIVNTEDFQNKLERLARFLGCEEPFAPQIFVYPTLDEANFETAFLMGEDAVLVAYHPSSKPEQERLRETVGVILHEICHAYIRGSSPFLKHKWIEGSPELMFRAYLDDGLVTCLGNLLRGDPDTVVSASDVGYLSETVDKFAHALIPLVRTYLSRGKAVDEEFIQRAGQIFDETFPLIGDDFEALFFSNPTILVDFSESEWPDDVVVPTILNHFFTTSVNAIRLKDKESTSAHIYIVKNSRSIEGVTLPNRTNVLRVWKDRGHRLRVLIQTDNVENINLALATLKKLRSYTKDIVVDLADLAKEFSTK